MANFRIERVQLREKTTKRVNYNATTRKHGFHMDTSIWLPIDHQGRPIKRYKFELLNANV